MKDNRGFFSPSPKPLRHGVRTGQSIEMTELRPGRVNDHVLFKGPRIRHGSPLYVSPGFLFLFFIPRSFALCTALICEFSTLARFAGPPPPQG